jgi:hypothetical protein
MDENQMAEIMDELDTLFEVSKQPPPKVVALMWASKRGPLVVRGLR